MVQSNIPFPALVLVVLQGELFHGYYFVVLSLPTTLTRVVYRSNLLYKSETAWLSPGMVIRHLSLCFIYPAASHDWKVQMNRVLGSHHMIQMQCISRMANTSTEDESFLCVCKSGLGNMAALGRCLELLF
jgi:hypothetical protein